MAPPDGASRPPIILSRVVLPQPDGPTMTVNSPSPISKDTVSTAWTVPPERALYVLEMLSSAMKRTCGGTGGCVSMTVRRAIPTLSSQSGASRPSLPGVPVRLAAPFYIDRLIESQVIPDRQARPRNIRALVAFPPLCHGRVVDTSASRPLGKRVARPKAQCLWHQHRRPLQPPRAQI